jgi:hypothetical protein
MSSSKRGKPAGGYRDAGAAPAQQRRGLFDNLLGPRTPFAAMPSMRTSVARGFVTVCSSPAILAVVIGAVFVEWVLLVALGFEGPFALLVGILAWPGPGTYLDWLLAPIVFGPSRGGLLSVFIFVIVRGAVLAVLTTMAVERLRVGRVSMWSLRRSLHVLPSAITASMFGVGVFLFALIAGQFLGQVGLGFLLFITGLVVAVWLTSAIPAIAADEDRPIGATLQRGIRFARTPGTGNLTLAALYGFPAFAALSAYAFGGQIGVNPSPTQWAVVLFVNVLHATAVAMFAFRYLAASPFVPEAPPVAPARRQRGGR